MKHDWVLAKIFQTVICCLKISLWTLVSPWKHLEFVHGNTAWTHRCQSIDWCFLAGAEVFFPDTETRRNHLLSMVDQVMVEGKAVSLAMTFESLCRFFSNKDASGLLGLPDVLPEVWYSNRSWLYYLYLCSLNLYYFQQPFFVFRLGLTAHR